MYTFIRGFLMTMGVLFCMLLALLAYLIIADPFHLRPLLTMVFHPVQTEERSVVSDESSGDAAVIDTVPATSTTEPSAPSSVSPTKTSQTAERTPVSAAQAEALKTIGIDAAAIPTTFTQAQLSCFVKVLGQARVAEITAGAVPTAAEFFSARTCIE